MFASSLPLPAVQTSEDEPLDLSVTSDRPLASVPASAPSDLSRFLDRLGDPDWWPSIDHQEAALRFICSALCLWPGWPAHVDLAFLPCRLNIQGLPDQPIHLLDTMRAGLLLAYQRDHWRGETAPLLIDASPSTAADRLRPLAAPTDFFAALAMGLAHLNGTPACRGQNNPDEMQRAGRALRRELTAWLRDSVPPPCPAPPDVKWHRSCAPYDPLASHPWASTQAGAASRRSPPASPTAVPERPPAAIDEVRHLADALAAGAWNDELYRLVPHLLARLPSDDPFSLRHMPLRLEDSRGLRLYGFTPRRGLHAQLLVRVTGTVHGSLWEPRQLQPWTVGPFQGPDAFFDAFLGVLFRHDATVGAMALRARLAHAVRAHSGIVRLCRLLHRRYPDASDPDRLLRQCLDGARLTMEGRQIMSPQYPLKALDHRAWATLLDPNFDVGQWRAWLHTHGYSLIDAYAELAAAFPRPGPVGRPLENDARDNALRRFRLQLLRAEGGRLLHVEASLHGLAHRLGFAHTITFDKHDQATERARMREEANRLDLAAACLSAAGQHDG